MKTITYNPETHVLVPASYLTVREIPPLFADEGRQEQLNQYHFIAGWNALVSLLAAAPQPEPNHNWCAGCSPDNCSGCGGEPVGYVAHTFGHDCTDALKANWREYL